MRTTVRFSILLRTAVDLASDVCRRAAMFCHHPAYIGDYDGHRMACLRYVGGMKMTKDDNRFTASWTASEPHPGRTVATSVSASCDASLRCEST